MRGQAMKKSERAQLAGHEDEDGYFKVMASHRTFARRWGKRHSYLAMARTG
jgi:hypothetical protein